MSVVQSLDIWLDGFGAPAGRLDAMDDGAVRYLYRPDYLEARQPPLSLSLPLREEAAGDAAARAFFGNLLPENDQMRRIIDREGLDRDDIVGILAHVGADCAGAISCLPEGSPPAKVPGVLASDYRPLGDDELVEIVASLADRQRLPAAVEDPSPVAGVQRKIALALLPDGEYALPRDGLRVPTTHILKVPRRDEGGDVALEAAASRLAAAANLPVSIPNSLLIGDTRALIITRFDRVVLDGVVYRRHQEDFAQALGLPAPLKYQREGREGRRFDAQAIAALLDKTVEPARARETFLLATLFNLAIGNSDNHAKNHAFLHDDAQSSQLAPLYDLLPVRIHHHFNHALAFDIGAARHFEEIRSEDIEALLAAFGLAGGRAKRFLTDSVRPMLAALEARSARLHGAGLKSFDDLLGRELSRLNELMDLGLDIRERDYFEPRAGGWTDG